MDAPGPRGRRGSGALGPALREGPSSNPLSLPSGLHPGGTRAERPTEQLKIELPILCGAIYPCSNPKLIAAVSEAGGLGVVQPISLAYVHGRDLRADLRRIRELTDKPIKFNAIVKRSSSLQGRSYRDCWQAGQSVGGSSGSSPPGASCDALERRWGLVPPGVVRSKGRHRYRRSG